MTEPSSPATSASIPANWGRFCLRHPLGLALVLSAVFHLAHYLVFPLPVGITYDGYEYLRLANVLAGDPAAGPYFFGRTPLYPLLLGVCQWAGGCNVWSIQIPNLLFGFAGILFCALAIRRAWGDRPAAAAVLLLTVCPLTVAYEHCLLSEASTFFTLGVLLFALVPCRPGWLGTLGVAGALILGFYARPTVLYLAPAAAILQGLACARAASGRREGNQPPGPPSHAANPGLPMTSALSAQTLAGSDPGAGGAGWLQRAARGLAHGTCVLLLVWAGAFPWNRALARSAEARLGGEHLVFAALKQALYPPDDPLVAPVAEAYRKALAACPGRWGGLDVAGLSQAAMVGFQGQLMNSLGDRGWQVLLEGIRSHPGRYALGVWRSLLYFGGRPTGDSENRTYMHGILWEADLGAHLWGVDHPAYPASREVFRQETRHSLLSRSLWVAAQQYSSLILAAYLATLFQLGLGLWRRDLNLIAWAAIPLAFILMHALALLAVDRFVVPALLPLLASLPPAVSNGWDTLRRLLGWPGGHSGMAKL